MQQRNAIQRWLDQADHNHPGGRAGDVTAPFALGAYPVSSGTLLVMDFWTLHAEEAVRVPTRTGTHQVYAVGIDLEGARRVSAVWMHHHSADPMELETVYAGSVGVDSWAVVMGDIEPWLSGLNEVENQQLGDSVFGQHADWCERYDLAVGAKRCPVIRSFTGRGSGVYDVYRMQRRGQSVGAYIEFLVSEDEAAQA